MQKKRKVHFAYMVIQKVHGDIDKISPLGSDRPLAVVAAISQNTFDAMPKKL